MKLENIIKLIDVIVPENKRGIKLRESSKTYFRNATLKAVIYEKVQVGLTIVCNKQVCEVTYAEIKRRE